jgi:hydroxylamine reductase (hybrid-cluster protein)
MQRRSVKQRGFQSNVPTLYTRGEIKYDKTDMTQSVKGWSEEGITRFNVLFDQVIADYARKPDFERKWLEERKSAQEEEGITEKKRKRQPTQARLEQLESDDEDDIVPGASEAPVEDSGGDTDEETN